MGNRCFTPRALAGLEDDLREQAHRIVWAAKREGTGDFVIDVARHLPLQAIAGLMGIPEADQQQFFHWSDQMAGSEDPEYASDLSGTVEMFVYAHAAAEARVEVDLGDVTSRLVRPDAKGERLTSEEFGFFFMILAVAGNETTRQAITHGMLAFLEHPDQWDRWRSERPATAVDEILRWASPAVVLQRTAIEDTEVAGRPVRQGERVGLYFASANFDEEVFDDPRQFDIGRSHNPHVTFGAGGSHFCIGANLSRLGAEGDVRRTRRRVDRRHVDGTARPPPVVVAQRHQAPAGRLRRLPMTATEATAWMVTQLTAPSDALQIQTVEVGDPGANQVRIDVEAFCLDFNDIDTIRGRYGLLKFEPPFVIGMAAAGTVEAAGPGCETLLGRRVVGVASGAQGAYASAALLRRAEPPDPPHVAQCGRGESPCTSRTC